MDDVVVGGELMVFLAMRDPGRWEALWSREVRRFPTPGLFCETMCLGIRLTG